MIIMEEVKGKRLLTRCIPQKGSSSQQETFLEEPAKAIYGAQRELGAPRTMNVHLTVRESPFSVLQDPSTSRLDSLHVMLD